MKALEWLIVLAVVVVLAIAGGVVAQLMPETDRPACGLQETAFYCPP
jgi:hypothetical protein